MVARRADAVRLFDRPLSKRDEMVLFLRISAWMLVAVLIADVLSAAAVAVAGRWDKVVGFAVLAGIVLVLGLTAVPRVFAAACAVCLLVAQWGTVLNWYANPWPVNALVHFATPGSVAAVLYFLLVRTGVFPPLAGGNNGLRWWAPAVWVATPGVTVAVLWELYEWAVGDLAPHVGYTDTVVDLFAGTLGCLTAGILVVLWARGHAARGPAARSTQ